MTDRPQIYVGTYGKYANGSIAGAWVSLDEHDTEESFYAAARALHKNEHDPELMFQDYEGFPSDLYGESHLDERLWEFLALDEHDREVVSAWLSENGGTDSIEYIKDSYLSRADSWQDYVDVYVDEHILPDIPESLRHYFDYEKYGRDLRHDYTVADVSGGVIIFLNH